ncbi:DUF2716 domain-containing protein [Streptacidiphilus monticola]
MTIDALRRLGRAESSEVWDRFDAAFSFRPSIVDFPGIREPAPSVTWNLASVQTRPGGGERPAFVEVVEDALAACTPPGQCLFILDWQHTSYALRPDLPPTDMFLPHALEGRARPGWPRSPYPHGDYCIFLSEDFTFGSFGHPWEPSLCLFGEALLDAVSPAWSPSCQMSYAATARP